MTDTAASRAWAWLRADLRRFDLAVALFTVAAGSLLLAGARDRFDTGWPEVAAGVGAFALVLFRRWHPLVLLGVSMVWTAVHVAVWERPTPTVFASIVLLATASVRLDRWRAIALGAAIGVSLYVLGLTSTDVGPGDERAVIGIAWAAMAVGIGDAVRSWRSYRESVEAQLQSTVAAAEARTRQQVSEERLEIARELHDLLAHNLSVMNVQTGAALHLLRADPDQAEESLVAARDAGKTVLLELRELLSVLRSDDGDEASPTSSLPTVEQLPALVETMRATGLAVTWHRTGEPRPLTPATSLAAYRITQEALTNAAKHGTDAADLLTEWDERGLTVRVRNRTGSGDAGVDDTGGGHGVVGMRERAAANGGELSADRVGDEFVVQAWLPAAADRTDDRTVTT